LDEALVRHLPAGTPPLPVRVVSRLASAPVWTGIALIAAVAVWCFVSLRAAAVLLLAQATAELASMVSKTLVARQVLDYDGGDAGLSWWDAVNSAYLFPSAHVVRATVLLGLLAFFFGRRVPALRVPIFIACATCLLILGYARVDMRAHIPTDVLGGYLLGAAWLVLSVMVAAWLDIRRHCVAATRTNLAGETTVDC
jgi:membrane-associated phospholipid phosphatase